MADDFNGSTATFPDASTSLGPLRSIAYTDGGADVDVSGGEDSAKTYEAGLSDIEVTVEIVGGTDVSKGDTGALAITWNDSGTDGTLANAIVSNVSTNGAMDGEITSSVAFKQTPT